MGVSSAPLLVCPSSKLYPSYKLGGSLSGCTSKTASNFRLGASNRRLVQRPARAQRKQPGGRHRSQHCTAQSSSVQAEVDVEEVQQRIRGARSHGRLDLSHMGLTELPAEVCALHDLVDLSLVGNRLTSLPEEFGQLTQLRRLGLAGNFLSELPSGIGNLSELEGIWLHGNLLTSLPRHAISVCMTDGVRTAQFGQLRRLKVVALSGNLLQSLPEEFCALSALVSATMAGNYLTTLPEGVGSLLSLKQLTLHGNSLRTLPASLTELPQLKELWLQGNQLRSIPEEWGGLKSLQQLSVADNRLQSVSASLFALPNLQSLALYGNQLQTMPGLSMVSETLRQVWIEGNPLAGTQLVELLETSSSTVGVDTQQAASLAKAPSSCKSNVRFGIICASISSPSIGYFKLDAATPGSWEKLPSGNARALVVAFGSAPGVPNWGGILNCIRKQSSSDAFDVLYVVDPSRTWYTDANESYERLGEYYADRLKAVTSNYQRVLLLGDSMGASAALLFSELATSVIAFCPQVDLTTAAIRPAKHAEWLQAFTRRVLRAVDASNAAITVHCGNWTHDLDQVNMLPDEVVKVVHPIDDHRVARALEQEGKLMSVVQGCLDKDFMGLPVS
eukprot:jgi/Chlat1/3078/Chrsp21S03388